MNEPFELPVSYKGRNLHFPAQLFHSGYSHRFQVNVYGQEVFFEPDEEGLYRAMSHPDDANEEINVDLLEAIAKGIEEVLR